VTNGKDFRVLDCATQAAHAMLRAGRKTADGAGKGAVHTRATGDSFDIAALMENLPEHIFGKLKFVNSN